MTNEQINSKIAEACGWTEIAYHKIHAGNEGLLGTHITADGARDRDWVPDYCADLNAMHEVENTLIFSERKLFRYCLQKVKGSEFGDSVAIALDECVHATARQRAEAFLRTIGKWEDEK